MFWKIFFWVYSLLVVALHAFNVAIQPDFLLIVKFLAVAILLIGLFSYAYKKPLFNPAFWKVAFAGLLLWDIKFIFEYLYHLDVLQGALNMDFRALTETIVFLIFLVPAYLSLYFLGFKSKALWAKEN